jgi:hypothetical protein
MSSPVPKRLTYLEDYTDEIEYCNEAASCEGDVVADISDKVVLDANGAQQAPDSPGAAAENWPSSLSGLAVGCRVDALDSRGNWFAGSIVEHWKVTSKDLPLLKQTFQECEAAGQSITSLPNESGLHIRVHFDNYSAKWDEWLSARDFANGRVQPVYTHTTRKTQIYHLTVYHRRIKDVPTLISNSSLDPKKQATDSGIDLVGVPFIVPVEPWRSCEHLYRHVVEQAFRFASTEEIRVFLEQALQPYLQRVYNMQQSIKEGQQQQQPEFATESSSSNGRMHISDGLLSSISWPQESLPFTVRIASFGNVAVAPSSLVLASRRAEQLQQPTRVSVSNMSASAKYGREHVVWEGTPFPADRNRPAGNLVHQKLCIVVDWKPLYRTNSPNILTPAVVSAAASTASSSSMRTGPHGSSQASRGGTGLSHSHADSGIPGVPSNALVDSRFVMPEYDDEESFVAAMQAYRESVNVSGNHRSNSSTGLQSARTSGTTAGNASSNTSKDRGVSLQECLKAYAGQEELLDENTWKCDKCLKHSKATVSTSLQRFPDTLIIHIKRFNMTARFGEKIKTLVNFPLRGLDLYPFSTECMKNSSHTDSLPQKRNVLSRNGEEPMCGTGGLGKSSSSCSQRYVYDLYGVTNHIGMDKF